MKTFITSNKEETILLGEKLIKALKEDQNVILLKGDLSSGKTTFTKGIGKALGITKVINSPTFTILKTYEGYKTLHHLDLYRLNDIGQDFDLEEYINDSNAVTVIEWPNQVEALIPNQYILVELTYLDENKREIKISSHNTDQSWEEKL
ncbi:tRNA (adenosine(37)-N6)-threonylcarbamoyltransferase complex ATPase subunit type 1 TsaE [Acholeplasma equifetale]|jgi:tRNA threonylcarbamoyladenosine biosynthesis protein TsaE|uniref:tRNA (adenosine(37)-N6)-threonylcarbamoyltransferase complex ATPase subunit type 1 TsaE n=1 Tax=Acholeplasma equifetale TaxID=264634 RepID=UPI00138ACE21|nr:tRNA (adenosine(37)-N6)-threonylcarbamoyltransferase complex ATPase subunit type 1 TsaE [Acholeplasma equifetale]HHY97023.1 tRNA (adenosine(37)-N6)-threonylcarbamoyltransferase complex ATPase subunit type 1 TsaE [Acholeplasma sp.]